MADEENTGEQQAAAGSTGQVAENAAQTGETTSAAGESQEQNQEEKQVAGLAAATVAEREKRQEAEGEVAMLKAQLQIASQGQQKSQVAQDMYGQVCESLGLNPDDYLTPQENRKVNNAILSMQQTAMTQSQFLGSHPDYNDVVGYTNPVTKQFVMAGPLKKAIDKNPGLLESLQGSANMGQLAYIIAKPEIDTVAGDKATDAAAIIENAQKSISNAAGSGTMDKANVIRNETDAEFQTRLEEVKSRAG